MPYTSEYAWGEDSEGSRRLAVALLAHAVSEPVAIRLHELLVAEMLGRFDPRESWIVASGELLYWAANAGLHSAEENIWR